MVVEVLLPDTATVNVEFKLLMLIAVPRIERSDRRCVVRNVGSGSAGATGSIETG